MAALHDLLVDLEDEYVDLRTIVEPFPSDAPEWDLATPAEGWSIRDQVSHLAFFDAAAQLALTEPARFRADADAAAAAVAAGEDPMAEHLARGRQLDGGELLAWWQVAHQGLAEALARVDPKDRIPWFGPPMGVASFVSARLMETWAHGQDIIDALGQPRVPTDRVRHIAHLGVRSRSFSYLVHGREVPAGHVEVALTGPSGAVWTWVAGEPVADGEQGRVAGSAVDFCLVVTQRRNLADTALEVDGGLAADWLSVAQAFAGPPGPGRPALTG